MWITTAVLVLGTWYLYPFQYHRIQFWGGCNAHDPRLLGCAGAQLYTFEAFHHQIPMCHRGCCPIMELLAEDRQYWTWKSGPSFWICYEINSFPSPLFNMRPLLVWFYNVVYNKSWTNSRVTKELSHTHPPTLVHSPPTANLKYPEKRLKKVCCVARASPFML